MQIWLVYPGIFVKHLTDSYGSFYDIADVSTFQVHLEFLEG